MFIYSYTCMGMTFDLFYISRSLVVPPVDHLNMSKANLQINSLLTFPSSSLPFRNIISSVSSSALDVQHFLKPLTVT
jgi:hypothetical protein